MATFDYFRSKIRTGKISTFGELKRDILLMFNNALMFNSRKDGIFKESMEMLNHVVIQINKAEFELSTSTSLLV